MAMLPKVAHYAGFQSYSQTPYSHLKVGKEKKGEYTNALRESKHVSYRGMTKTMLGADERRGEGWTR